MTSPHCQVCGKQQHPSTSPTVKSCRRCWLLAASTRFAPTTVDRDFGNWLAGFVAGEGNFQAHTRGRDGGFCFRIILREDDKAILEEVRARLGVGVLYYRDVVKAMPNWNPKYQTAKRSNQWAYLVQPVVDLAEVIVPLFEQYRLRARKAEQFEVWKKRLKASAGVRLLERAG